MNILNLGGGGFIGSHLTKRLLDEGHSVTAVDLWTDKVGELLDHPRLTFVPGLASFLTSTRSRSRDVQAANPPAAEGVGLSNTRARLQALYGEAHGFELRDAPEGGLLVRLIIPFRKENSPA